MNQRYLKWLNEPSIDPSIHDELKSMDEATIEDAFYKHLSFGTGGMRGIVGAGTNRLNIYTVRRAIYAYAQFLLDHYDNAAARGVAIAHDNRNKSIEFAQEAVGVLAAFGIKSYLFDALRPTPELSFAVRHHGAAGGIMVTASHNPPEYNGVKMYDHNGCQLTPELADRVIEFFNDVSNLFAIESVDFDTVEANKLITTIGEETDSAYIKSVHTLQWHKGTSKNVRIVFTPLHGTARTVLPRALREAGFEVITVDSQMTTDPTFSTVDSPNPESEAAFAKSIEVGKANDADLLIATDPDGDRLAIMPWHEGKYHFLSGNQTGAVFIDYLLKNRKDNGLLPAQGVVYNTIVTSDFGASIAKSYGMDVVSTLTGFKFIGEQMEKIENTDTEFIMGYEESYGYVITDIVRDKDSVQAALLGAEIADVLANDDKTFIDYLQTLYATHGYYRDRLLSINLKGQAGETLITNIMTHFRSLDLAHLNDRALIAKEDYQHGTRITKQGKETMNYPKSNVVKFIFDDDMWFTLRPSGTEPKLKVYMNVSAASEAEADRLLDAMETKIKGDIDAIQNQKGVKQ